MARGTIAAAILVGLLLPSNAVAATVAIGKVRARDPDGQLVVDERLTVRASPGERNDVVVRTFNPDPGEDAAVSDRVPLVPGHGCRRGRDVRHVLCHFQSEIEEALDRHTPPPVRALLGDRGDRFRTNESAEVHGGSGNDRLIGGRDESVLDGGPGADRLRGRASFDVYEGGASRDGADTFLLGSEQSVVDYRRRTTPVALGVDGRRNDGARGERDRLVYAGATSIDLYGGSKGDVLRAGRHGQALYGGAGADVLVGNRGDNTLVADGSLERPGRRRDADRLYGGGGDDSLLGNAGPNVLVGGSGIDLIQAGGGADRVELRDRDPDDVRCGAGADRARLDMRDALRPAARCEQVLRRSPPIANLDVAAIPVLGYLDGDDRAQDVPLSCPVDALPRCHGRVSLRYRHTVVASARFSIARGHSEAVSARLNRTARRIFERLYGSPVTIEITARDRTGVRRRVRSRRWIPSLEL